jgi:hypothetical protein
MFMRCQPPRRAVTTFHPGHVHVRRVHPPYVNSSASFDLICSASAVYYIIFQPPKFCGSKFDIYCTIREPWKISQTRTDTDSASLAGAPCSVDLGHVTGVGCRRFLFFGLNMTNNTLERYADNLLRPSSASTNGNRD